VDFEVGTGINFPVAVACRSVWSWTLEHWNRGFSSRSKLGCMSAFFFAELPCVGTGLAIGRSSFKGDYRNL